MNPRPYSRMYQLTGTHGYANKYPLEEYCFRPDQIKSDEVPDHENLNMHAAISAEVKEALMKNISTLSIKNWKRRLKSRWTWRYGLHHGLPSGVLSA